MNYGKNFLCSHDSIFYVKDISNASSFNRNRANILNLNITNNKIKIEFITFCLPSEDNWKDSNYDNLYEYFQNHVKSTKKLNGYYDWTKYDGYYDVKGKLKYQEPIYIKNRSDLTIEKVKEYLDIDTNDFDKEINDFIKLSI